MRGRARKRTRAGGRLAADATHWVIAWLAGAVPLCGCVDLARPGEELSPPGGDAGADAPPADAATEAAVMAEALTLTLPAVRFVPSPDRMLPLEASVAGAGARALSLVWRTRQGPASALFTATGPLSAKASFRVAGTYEIEAEVRAGDHVATAAMVVHVLEVQNGLLAHWPFEESAGDVTHASGTQALSLRIKNLGREDGVVGRAAVLRGDGDDGALGEVGSALFEKTTEGDFAVSLWFKDSVPEVEADAAVLLRYVSSPGGDTLGWELLMLKSGILILQSFGPNDGKNSVQRAGLRNDGWHHALAQRRAGDLELWIDGRFSVRGPGPLAKVKATLYVGGVEGMAWADYDGALDEVRVFTRALAQDEIAYLANRDEQLFWRGSESP